MQRIVFLVNSLAGGGAERSIVNLLAYSGEWLEGYEAHLILLDNETEAYSPPAGVTVHRLNAKKSLLNSVFQLTRVLLKIRPVIVVSALTRSNLSNVISASFLRHRALICEHAHTGGHHHGLGGWIAKQLIRFFYPRADAVMGVSQDIINELVQHFAVSRERTIVLSNPVDVDEIRRKSDEPLSIADHQPYILGMGRLVESKNFPLLVRAFAASGFPGSLVILGQGPEREKIEATIAELGLSDRALLLGFTPNPFPIVKGAAGYVLCSNGEGLPTGLIEAMVVGIPVIATNCRSGPSEVLDEVDLVEVTKLHQAKYGILVPTNEIAPMAQAIAMLSEPATRAELSTRSRLGSTRYDLERTISAYWNWIRKTAI